MRVRLWLIVLALLSVALPIQAQGTFLYFPIILKDPASMAYKSTLGIISPYGNSNYVLNSSGETTDNFSVQGSASVSRVTTFQKYGLYSYQITTTGDGDGINLTLSSLTSAPHYVTFRRRLAEAVRLNVTIGSATKEARLLERIDTTWSLYYATFSSAEVSGQTNLRVTQIGAGANTMYLDGAQVEPNKLTTYIDGTQEGCRWNGATHASTSTRSADSRAGGAVKDFWQDYGFVVERVLGAGSVTETLNIDSYAFLPGGELNSSKIQPREFTVIGFFLGDTREDLHARVQSLELELGLNTYPGQQPIRLRYSGARVLKEIAANYTEGLEGDLPIFYNDEFSIEGDDQWQRNYTFRMKASIQFIATDPFWYEVGESAALLDTNDTATFRYIAGRLQSTGQWSNLGITGNPTGFGDVYTIAISPFDGKIYIGGAFKDWDSSSGRDHCAAYDPATGLWENVGNDSDFNNTVKVLKFGPDGTLYAGGDFTNVAGNANADYFARKPSGSGWTNLGTGGTAAINTITIAPNGDIYIGGSFSDWAGIPAADKIAYYDISSAAWAAVIVGASSDVHAIVFTPDGDTAYFGGAFTNWGDANGDYIVSWDGTALTSLLTGADNAVHSLLLSPDGVLYLGGLFQNFGSISASAVGLYNGQVFQGLGNGINQAGDAEDVLNMALGPDGVLYIAGYFDEAGDISVFPLLLGVVRWNGYTYARLDIDLPASTVNVRGLAVGEPDPIVRSKYDLFIGFDDNGTGAFAGLETVQNEGTISAFPKIVFSRSGGTGATIQTLRNERTGRELIFNYALLDGESLTIDLYPKNRKVTSSFFGQRMDAILPNSDFSVWQLLPGENNVTAFVSESGSPTVTGYLLYREAFRSWN